MPRSEKNTTIEVDRSLIEAVDAYAVSVGSSRRQLLPKLVNIGLAGLAIAEARDRENRIYDENSRIYLAVAQAAGRRGMTPQQLWQEITGEPVAALVTIPAEFKH